MMEPSVSNNLSEYADLLRDLNSWSGKCAAASQRLRTLTPETLFTLLDKEVERKKRLYRRYGLLLRTLDRFHAPFVIGIVAILVKNPSFVHFVSSVLLITFTGIFCSAFERGVKRPSFAAQKLFERIEQTADERTVPVLMEFWEQAVGEECKKASALLKTLLPRLRMSHTKDWTLEQRKTLLLPLASSDTDIDLKLTVLKALEQVGGAEAIPLVSRLAAGKWRVEYPFPVRVDKKVQQAAEACLPFLQQTDTERQMRDTLLRPSSANSADAPETLLRPVVTNPDQTPAEQLLRPHE